MQPALDIYLHDGQSNHGTVRKKKRRSAPSTELFREKRQDFFILFFILEDGNGHWVLFYLQPSRVESPCLPRTIYTTRCPKVYISTDDEEASSSKPYGQKPGAQPGRTIIMALRSILSMGYGLLRAWRLSAFSRAIAVYLRR